MTKLMVEKLDENPEVPFTGLLEYTAESGSVEEQYYVGITEGTWGIRADGTTYWTPGDVPRAEQARLTLEDGKYYLTKVY